MTALHRLASDLRVRVNLSTNALLRQAQLRTFRWEVQIYPCDATIPARGFERIGRRKLKRVVGRGHRTRRGTTRRERGIRRVGCGGRLLQQGRCGFRRAASCSVSTDDPRSASLTTLTEPSTISRPQARVKRESVICRCSMIMSGFNCSVKMSVHARSKIDSQGAEADTGAERSAGGRGDGGCCGRADGSERAPCMATDGSVQEGGSSCYGSREQG